MAIFNETVNESEMRFASKARQFEDKRNFVRNFGMLLFQTRAGVFGCDIDANSVVTIFYEGGATKRVDVDGDSYTAIMKDILKQI